MCGEDFDTKQLTKEKSLWEIYRASRRIPTNKFNAITTLIIFLLIVVEIWFSSRSSFETVELVRRYAEIGLTVSIGALGFLIAGFTIFATVSQPTLFIEMARIRHPDSDLPYLKHNFFLFLRVFVYYLSFSAFCLAVITFGQSNGLAAVLAKQASNTAAVTLALVNSSYLLILTGFWFLIVQLKSFVFNIHHAVMTALRWRAEGWDKEN